MCQKGHSQETQREGLLSSVLRKGPGASFKRLFAVSLLVIIANSAPFGLHAKDAKDVSTDKEWQKLVKESQEFETKYNKSDAIYKDDPLEEYIKTIGHLLVKQAAGGSGQNFRFKVINDPTLNAFALPNGAIYIHSGLLARLENEAQVAMILGHETIHVINHHSLKGSQKKGLFKKIETITKEGARTLGKKDEAAKYLEKYARTPLQQAMVKDLENLGLSALVNGYDRELEKEADKEGVALMYKAGYDPREAPKPFELFLKTSGDKSGLGNFFYGDHPKNAARVEYLNSLLESEYKAIPGGQALKIDSPDFQRRTRRLVRDTAYRDYSESRYEQAEALLQRLLKVEPNDYVAHHYLGLIYHKGKADGLEKAIAEYNQAIKIKRSYPDVYKDLGYAYSGKRDYARAISALQTYLKLDPDTSERKQVQKAIKDWKEEMELDRKSKRVSASTDSAPVAPAPESKASTTPDDVMTNDTVIKFCKEGKNSDHIVRLIRMKASEGKTQFQLTNEAEMTLIENNVPNEIIDTMKATMKNPKPPAKPSTKGSGKKPTPPRPKP